MKLFHRSFASLMLFAFAGLLNAQSVPPGTEVDTGTPWGLVSCLVSVGLLGGGFLIGKAVLDGRTSKASLQWLSAPGTVVFSQMVEYDAGGAIVSSDVPRTGSRPEVRYSYVVNGQACQSSRVKFGMANSQKILAKYPMGNRVQVFFDPQQPSNAVLERGGSTQPILFSGVGIIIFTGLIVLLIVKL